jgi:hypothetical protein
LPEPLWEALDKPKCLDNILAKKWIKQKILGKIFQAYSVSWHFVLFQPQHPQQQNGCAVTKNVWRDATHTFLVIATSVARFYLVQTYQNLKNIPNVDPMSVKYNKIFYCKTFLNLIKFSFWSYFSAKSGNPANFSEWKLTFLKRLTFSGNTHFSINAHISCNSNGQQQLQQQNWCTYSGLKCVRRQGVWR